MRVTLTRGRSISPVETDPLDTRAQEQRQADQAERQRLRKLRSDSDFVWLMSTGQGRRIVWDLLSTTGAFRNPFTGDEWTGFRCGEMNIGQQYLAKIHELCPERYHEMVKEQQEK